MIDEETKTYKRFFFCENCGGDKPWARQDWLMDGMQSFCSRYCWENFQSFVARMARKGKKIRV
jgi:hypothetical protein